MTQQSIKINADQTVTVMLSNGNSYILREPLGKDMANLGQDLIKIKHTDTVQKLLGHIAMPPITRQVYANLTFADTQALNAAIDFFSAPPAAKAEMLSALSELGYLSESDSAPTSSPE